jgi:hypothetical protein
METGWDDVEVGEQLGRTTRRVVRPDGVVQQDETTSPPVVTRSRRPVSTAGHAVDEIAPGPGSPRLRSSR